MVARKKNFQLVSSGEAFRMWQVFMFWSFLLNLDSVLGFIYSSWKTERL